MLQSWNLSLNDNDEEEHHAIRPHVLKMQAVEKPVAACPLNDIPNNIEQSDVEFERSSTPSLNSNQSKTDIFSRMCYGDNKATLPQRTMKTHRPNTLKALRRI